MARSQHWYRQEPKAAPIGRADPTIRRLTLCTCFRRVRSPYWVSSRLPVRKYPTWTTSWAWLDRRLGRDERWALRRLLPSPPHRHVADAAVVALAESPYRACHC